jgi:hypothetical protein
MGPEFARRENVRHMSHLGLDVEANSKFTIA